MSTEDCIPLVHEEEMVVAIEIMVPISVMKETKLRIQLYNHQIAPVIVQFVEDTIGQMTESDEWKHIQLLEQMAREKEKMLEKRKLLRERLEEYYKKRNEAPSLADLYEIEEDTKAKALLKEIHPSWYWELEIDETKRMRDSDPSQKHLLEYEETLAWQRDEHQQSRKAEYKKRFNLQKEKTQLWETISGASLHHPLHIEDRERIAKRITDIEKRLGGVISLFSPEKLPSEKHFRKHSSQKENEPVVDSVGNFEPNLEFWQMLQKDWKEKSGEDGIQFTMNSFQSALNGITPLKKRKVNHNKQNF